MTEEDLNLPEKVAKYEEFLNHQLKADLKKILKNLTENNGIISEYLQLKTTIEKLKEGGMLGRSLKTQVDLGCNFYAQAKIDDPSRLSVSIGYGFYLEMTLEEAVKFIEKKVALLEETSLQLSADACRVKANIKLVLEALRELQLPVEERPKQREF